MPTQKTKTLKRKERKQKNEARLHINTNTLSLLWYHSLFLYSNIATTTHNMDKKKVTTVSSYADKMKAKRVSVSSKGDAVTKSPLSSSKQQSASSSHHSTTFGPSLCDASQHETSNPSLTQVTSATSNEGRKKNNYSIIQRVKMDEAKYTN